ncbi:unnamed protein product [Rodentolepis nana]|uniref:Cilia- and flagella-associated protein 126 n=1 Tax=Rodentolepis nana TaxID=102285 RepID=A0A0R3TCA1_RODNA|nr:unnamed protein product [Rodentolepis nana]
MNAFPRNRDIPMVLRGGDNQFRNERINPPTRHKSMNPGVNKSAQLGTWAGPRSGFQSKTRNRSVSPVRSRIPKSQSPQYHQHILSTSSVPKQNRVRRTIAPRPWIA